MANGTDSPHPGQDLRRDMRFEVSQAAMITQPGHPDVACDIRDFCQGGLFLKFINPETAIATLSQRSDSAVEVVFTTGAARTAQTFRIPARIKRMNAPGVGVAFDRQPTEALRSLQKLRMAAHRQKFFNLPSTHVNLQLREACTTLLNETLVQVHEQMMRILGEKLSTASARAASISEHSGLLSAMREFQTHASAVQSAFICQTLDTLRHARPLQTQATRGTANGELELVDEAGFEDWLATSSEANKLEEHFQEHLLDIEPRIGQLFEFSCGHSNNPFGPAIIGHSYRTAVHAVPVSSRARQVAYATLREVLSEQLELLYAELLALLPVAPVKTNPRQRRDPAERPGVPANPAEVNPTPNRGPAGPVASRGALSQLTGSLMDFFRGNAPAQTADPSEIAPLAEGMSLPPTASQHNPAASRAGGVTRPMMGSPGIAHSPVLQRLAAAGALPANATPDMQRSVDMFGALFDTMHAERSISEGMRPFFQRMESSLIKLAMDDPQFLASPAHPAHKVLNTLDRISMAAGDEGKVTDARLLRLMNRWTDRINAEADKNPGVFQEARTQLERVVKPLLNERAARVFRLQEMCEGRQRAEVAKQRILGDLLARLDEKKVPTAVIELLNGGWRNVLLIAEMRHGVDSAEAKAAWNILNQLCVWLDPNRVDLPAATEIQRLLQHIDEALTQVCADKFAQDRIVDQLATALLDENTSQHRYTSVAGRLNDASNESLTESQDTLVERLRVGDWLQFTSTAAPLNLIWIGDQPPVYVFANYRGIKKLDLKRTDFLKILETGDAEWAEDLELPLMDRSYSAMIQKMQRDLAWQSSHDAETGLSNRKTFFRAIRRNWLRSRPDENGYALGVVQLQICNAAGEAAEAARRTFILRDLAQQLSTRLPPNALLARAGESGLTFWIEAADGDAATQQAKTLLHLITGQPQEIGGTHYRVGAAIGLMWASDCLSPETYYDNANAASTRARESETRVMLYSSEAGDSGVLALAQWAHQLTAILVNNQLSLDCQPIVASGDATHTPIYYEVLLHSSAGQEQPAARELTDIAERLQRITEIDRWVVRHVLQWMRDHADKTAALGGFSINLSGQSVTNPLFLKFLLGELASGDIPGNRLIFEIRESDAIDGHAQTQLFMRQLQRHGCRFMLGEFGAGSSSFTRLKSMKLDYLKIDPALVREVASSMIDEALVRSILETGSFLGIKTVASHVEDQATRAKLAEMGVDCIEGPVIAEPHPLQDLA